MHGYTQRMAATGELLHELAADQAEWSQRTFGTDQERPPVGALKHLAKEAIEALEAIGEPEKFAEECADCLLLILDASRRGGINPVELLKHATAKMQINKCRTWPTPKADEPVEHVR